MHPTSPAPPADAPSFSPPAGGDVAPTPAPAPAPPDLRCANCSADGCDQFCPRCGQETHDLHRSLGGIVGDVLDAFAGWDGKIPTTLWMLVRRPGGLTAEFLAGRRARYLRPLRLYLTMSVAFFLSLTLVERPSTPGAASGVRTAGTAIRLDPEARALIERHRNDGARTPTEWVTGRFVRGVAKMQAMPKEQQQATMLAAFVSRAPNMMFLLLPVFALLLRLLYLRTPVFYAEHLVFALHNHAFAFLAMTAGRLASVWLDGVGLGAVAAVPVLWMPVYFFASMRRVYGGTRGRTTLKFVALATSYGAILLGATILTMLFSIATLV